MRILFVENHGPFSKLVTSKFLADHDVQIVGTLTAARRELLEADWDIVLLDYDLDDGKGIALVKELEGRADRPYIIGVSAYDDQNEALRQAGADAACGKLQFAQIQEVLRSLRN